MTILKTGFGLLILGALVALVIFKSFYANPLQSYQDTSPVIDFRNYFNGPIKAWGIVQDWRGRVVTRFDIKMIGTWDGDTGTLKEHFDYYNGKTQERMWTIHKHSNGAYEGTAPDVKGLAKGYSSGSAVHWRYVMNLAIGDKTYAVNFDDWMWMMHDDVLINRSYIKKFGITVAELTIFMQKRQ
jgi:hypothetical protein